MKTHNLNNTTTNIINEMNMNNISQNIELSDKAIKSIQTLREMEKEGVNHQQFFFELMAMLSNELAGQNDPEANKRFRECFDALAYYSRVLAEIVED